MPAQTQIRRLLAASLAGTVIIGSIASLSGCAKGGLRSRMLAAQSERLVEIEGGPVNAGRFTALDIENLNGSVRVFVSDRYEEATVEYRVRKSGEYTNDLRKELHEMIWIAATNEGDMERTVLRVLSAGIPDNLYQPKVDITVRTPVCDGLQIRNAGGPVEVVGVRGAIAIENGYASGSGGWVDVRTEEPLVDPITITTSEGNITLLASPDSSGTFDVSTDDGRASFSSRYGSTSSVQPTTNRWTGTWNDGTNEVVLRTGSGHAMVKILENPVDHTVMHRWPSSF